MKASKCDPPGEHFLELLGGGNSRKVDDISKQVYLRVKEEVYGNMQWIHKSTLVIFPFKKEHWWDSINKDNPFVFEERDFRYAVVHPEE